MTPLNKDCLVWKRDSISKLAEGSSDIKPYMHAQDLRTVKKIKCLALLIGKF